jgi:hypothetical protein
VHPCSDTDIQSQFGVDKGVTDGEVKVVSAPAVVVATDFSRSGVVFNDDGGDGETIGSAGDVVGSLPSDDDESTSSTMASSANDIAENDILEEMREEVGEIGRAGAPATQLETGARAEATLGEQGISSPNEDTPPLLAPDNEDGEPPPLAPPGQGAVATGRDSEPALPTSLIAAVSAVSVCLVLVVLVLVAVRRNRQVQPVVMFLKGLLLSIAELICVIFQTRAHPRCE